MNVGEIYMYGGSIAPTGFLLCNGAAVSRATYSELYSVIGDTFGAGDGNSTFNVPDLTGKVIIGTSASHSLGDAGGEETHILLESELPAHSHTLPSHGHANTIGVTTPALAHSITQPAFTYSAPSGTGKRPNGTVGYSKVTSTNATRSANLAIADHAAANCSKTGGVSDCAAFDTDATGTGTGHDNMQPYVTVNHIIYTGVTQ